MNRRRVAGFAVVGVLVLLFGGRWVALRYTEHAWFADQGLADRYWSLLLRALGWQLGTLAVATAWYSAQTLAVHRSIGSVRLPRHLGNLEIAEEVPRRLLRGIAVLIALLIGGVTAYGFSDLDHLVALYRHATPLGLPEPVLGRDASFYLTRLPLLETLHLMASVTVALAGVLAVGLYALTGSLAFERRRLLITPHARTHVIVLLSLLALVIAWGFHLDAYQLVGGGGHSQGALSAVDRSIRIPASRALVVIGLVVAVGTVLALRWMRPGLLFGFWATLGVATLLGRVLVPVLTEAGGGRSSAAMTQAVASYADGYSRAGFGLLDLRSEPLAAKADVPEDSVEALGMTLAGLSPWSGEPGLLDAAIAASSGDSTPARVWVTTIDRYDDPAGTPRLVAVAVPQTDPLLAARTVPRTRWTERHRGALAWGGDPVAVDAGARSGAPRFLSALAPVDGAPVPTSVRRAPGRIRFLPRPAELGVIGPDEGAVGEPPPGLGLGGFVRRLLFAWALQAPPLLDEHTSTADRVLVWRDIPQRLARLFPFAAFDPPRPALVGERLLWIVDGYLASARFPLAEHVRWQGDLVNFLAAPYVVTVDAVSGATRLYLRPPELRFAAAVARAEGVNPLPSDSLSAELRRRLRYPTGLFGAQGAVLARRGDDRERGGPRWALAANDSGLGVGDAVSLRPAVALMSLGAEPPALWQLLPLTDAAGNRLTAIVAGAGAENGTLRLRLLRLPTAGFPTPSSAAGRLGSSAAVLASAATAAGSEGAVRRGPVVPVPAAGTVAYTQVLYASRDRTAEPLRVRGFALLVGDRVGVGTDFGGAARALWRGEAAEGHDVATASSLAEARVAFIALDSAVRRADWGGFGRAYAALRRALGVEGVERP